MATTNLRMRTIMVPLELRDALTNSLATAAPLFFVNASGKVYAWFDSSVYAADSSVQYIAVTYLMTIANDTTFMLVDLPTLITQNEVDPAQVMTFYTDGVTADF